MVEARVSTKILPKETLTSQKWQMNEINILFICLIIKYFCKINLQIFYKFSNFQIFKFSNFRIFKFSNFQIFKYFKFYELIWLTNFNWCFKYIVKSWRQIPQRENTCFVVFRLIGNPLESHAIIFSSTN